MQERRSQIHGVARELQIALGGTGTHPWSRWQDQPKWWRWWVTRR